MQGARWRCMIAGPKSRAKIVRKFDLMSLVPPAQKLHWEADVPSPGPVRPSPEDPQSRPPRGGVRAGSKFQGLKTHVRQNFELLTGAWKSFAKAIFGCASSKKHHPMLQCVLAAKAQTKHATGADELPSRRRPAGASNELGLGPRPRLLEDEDPLQPQAGPVGQSAPSLTRTLAPDFGATTHTRPLDRPPREGARKRAPPTPPPGPLRSFPRERHRRKRPRSYVHGTCPTRSWTTTNACGGTRVEPPR